MKKKAIVRVGFVFIISLALLLILGVGDIVSSNKAKDVKASTTNKPATNKTITNKAATSKTTKRTIYVNSLDFNRESDKKIKLSWSDRTDTAVKKYVVMRAAVINGNSLSWQKVAEITSDKKVDGTKWTYTDTLPSTEKRQYWYRVDVVLANQTMYKAKQGKKLLTSNVMICIDPGHYAGSSDPCQNNSYGYTEGEFTLKVGLQLRKYLKQQYGIDSNMTRTTGTIQIGGYSNATLDRGHISLRGAYAKQTNSDLFVSLHTNANNENANGYPTWAQPVSINKTIILANKLVCDSDKWIDLCNCIGEEVTTANRQAGLLGDYDFTKAKKGNIKEWTDVYNDSVKEGGTVCKRISSTGNDYYGVLRGANEANVPAIIIEHGYHTVEEIRKQAMEGNLKLDWAQADAAGIARGFGFIKVS